MGMKNDPIQIKNSLASLSIMCLHVQTTFQRGNNSSVDPGAANGILDLAGLKAEDKTLVHQVQMKLSCMCTLALACLPNCPRVLDTNAFHCYIACAQHFVQRRSGCADAAEVRRHRSSCSSSCQSQALGFVFGGGILSTGDCSPGSWYPFCTALC